MVMEIHLSQVGGGVECKVHSTNLMVIKAISALSLFKLSISSILNCFQSNVLHKSPDPLYCTKKTFEKSSSKARVHFSGI